MESLANSMQYPCYPVSYKQLVLLEWDLVLQNYYVEYTYKFLFEKQLFDSALFCSILLKALFKQKSGQVSIRNLEFSLLLYEQLV